MNSYDSILKEKKVYKEYVPSHTIFKKFILGGILLSFFVICVSYVIYYNSFLNGETIILNNFFKIIDDYSVIKSGLNNGYDFDDSYMLDGDVVFDKYKYKYTFIRDNNKLKRSFFNDNKMVNYYYDGDSNYIKLSDLDEYISYDAKLFDFASYKNDYDMVRENIFDYLAYVLFDNSIMNMDDRLFTIDNFDYVLGNIRNNFLSFISDKNYSKKFYFYNGRPVVMIDVILNSNDINTILSNGDNNLIVKDDYDVVITSRNDAIMNDIKNMKVVIKNNTKDTRIVIFYDGKDIIFTDVDGVEYRYSLSVNDNDFILKIYKGNVLYSALEGEKDGNDYVYNYQYIDKLERYSLDVSFNDNKYVYKFSSNIDNNVKNMIVNLEYYDEGAVDENDLDVVMYRDVGDKYRDVISGNLIDFLNKK